jgi:DNA-directed RNA polymerase subunit N (RpoN/RPB10)
MSLDTHIPQSYSYFVCLTASIPILELFAKFKRLIERDVSKHAALKEWGFETHRLMSLTVHHSQTGIEGHEERI